MYDLAEVVHIDVGNIVIARIQTADEAPQALKRIQVVFTGVDQAHRGLDVVGHVRAGLDADDTAAFFGHGGMNQLDELLGLAGAVVAHNQSNHKRSLLLHICIPYHNSAEMAMGKYTVFYRPSFSRRAWPMSS